MNAEDLTDREIAIKALKRLNRFQKTFEKTTREIQKDVSKLVEGGVYLAPPTNESGGQFSFFSDDMADHSLVKIVNSEMMMALLEDLEDGELIDGNELFSY